MYIYTHTAWPRFEWDATGLQSLLSEVRNQQGIVVGKMGALGFDLLCQANLQILTQDVLTSSEIEGEILNHSQVRSSLARRLGLDISGPVHSDRNVDGVVEMTVDATTNFADPLTKDRLFAWHNALFPGGRSGMDKVLVACWRTDSSGPMQAVSGAMGKETVYFRAPPASRVEKEMQSFLRWMHSDREIDLVVMAALAHLWFVTIYPFEDGNGRIARAIADMVLARSDKQAHRFYSLSAQIRNERRQYYDILERTQKGSLDVSDWLHWFLECLLRALQHSDAILQNVVYKHRFWMENSDKVENKRQKKILDMLIDGYEGKLTTSKWAKLGKCSQDTALRDIQKLIDQGVLFRLPGGGRSTGYDIVKNDV